MAVFRVEKSKDFTIMCNHHLRNRDLSLKAKGLLSQMLSLPDNWDYTLQGLAHINLEKIDAIRQAVRELERAGYITRQRERDDKGMLRGTVYVIREQPEPPTLENPILDKPTLDNPTLENPTLDKPTLGKPTLENPTQLNKYISSKEIKSKDISNIHQSISPASLTDGMDAIGIYAQIVKENIDYDNLCRQFDRTRLDEIVELIMDTLCANRSHIRICGQDYPADSVKCRLLKLDASHIEYVFDCLDKNTTKIRNIKSYLISALYNAPATINSYYHAEVNHDLCGGDDS